MIFHLIVFGAQTFFTFYYNWLLLPTILTHLIWTFLDIMDRGQFRELGAFRFLRVIIIVLEFNEARFIIESKFLTPYCTKTVPLQNKINKILLNLQNKIPDREVKEEIEYCSELVKRIKMLPSSYQNTQKSNKNNQEFLINSSVLAKHKRRDSYHVRQMIKDKVERQNFNSELMLTTRVKKLLQKVDQFEFDMFELSNATNGNELITVSTFLLLNKHNLFVA